jgi:hypothetical protein
VVVTERDQALAQVKKLKAEAEHMSAILNSVQTELINESRAHKAQLSASNKRLKQVEGQVAQTRLELGIVKKQLKEERIAWGPRHFANATKVSDSVFQGKWKELGHRIRSLADLLLQFQNPDTIPEDIDLVMRGISANYIDLMRDEEGCRGILQAYLWRLVHKRIMDGWAAPWAHDPRHLLHVIKGSFFSEHELLFMQAFDPLTNSLLAETSIYSDKDAERFSKWISDGRQQFEELIQERDRGQLKELSSMSLPHLAGLIRNSSAKPEAVHQVDDDLQKIFASAIELEEMMLSSRAYYDVTWLGWDSGSPVQSGFDPDFVERLSLDRVLKDSNSPCLMLSPALIKCGNADGQHYDEHIVLVKACL